MKNRYINEENNFLTHVIVISANLYISPISGNKIDREDREIPMHVGEDFAQRHGMYFLETSAKEAENVERLFMEIAAELMEVSTERKISLEELRFFRKKKNACHYNRMIFHSKHAVRNYLDTKRTQLR